MKLTKALLAVRTLRGLLGDSARKYFLLYWLATVSALLEVLSVGLIFPLLYVATNTTGSTDQLPAFFVPLITLFAHRFTLEWLGVFLIGIFVVKNVIKFFVEYGNARITNEIRGRWMVQLFDKYLRSHYLFFIETKHGVLIHNLFNLTEQVLSGVRQLVVIFMNGFSFIIVATGMFLISWKISLLSIVMIMCGYALLNKYLVSQAARLGKKRLAIFQQVNAVPSEAFKGIREIKTYSVEDKIAQEYKNGIRKMSDLLVKIYYYQLLPPLFPETLLVTVLIVALVVITKNGHTNLALLMPELATYAYALYRLFLSGSLLAQASTVFMTYWPSMQYLAESLADQRYAETQDGQLQAPRDGDSIRCKNISFAYGITPILSDVTTEFHRGKLTTIVGGSGAGKSTIADLLMRILAPTSGTIEYGGKNITNYTLASWRNLIGFVSQDTFLFHGTIRENIAFGNPQATDNDVVAAAKSAHAHDFIISTPAGYNSIVGERGAKLSGGQRQRIAIARALVRQPAIVIFDEATSALDTENEAMIMATIQELKTNTIVIVITHKLSMIDNADTVLVMKSGHIVKDGLIAEKAQASATLSLA